MGVAAAGSGGGDVTAGVAYDCLIRNCARIVVCGASGSGKTQCIKNLLLSGERAFEVPPERIYVFHLHWQPAYEELRSGSRVPVEFAVGPPPADFRPVPRACVVFDDLQSSDSGAIEDFYLRRAHHEKCSSVVYVLQNLLVQNKTNRNILLNSSYYVLFRPRRDVSQVERLNYALLGSGHKRFLLDVFKSLSKGSNFSPLLVDLDPATPDAFQFRSTVVPQSGQTVAFVPVSGGKRS